MIPKFCFLILELTRRRYLQAVGDAYTSIRLADFANYVGLSEPEAKALASEQSGWEFDSATNMILPQRIQPAEVPPPPSAEKIHQLTQYISYLEQ